MSSKVERLASKAQLAGIVRRLGSAIEADHEDGVLLVGVLKGSLLFLADLCRAITVPCEIEFLGLSAYSPGETRVRITKDLDRDVIGRSVVLVQEIVDTGMTTAYVVSLLQKRGAASVRVCTLLDRQVARILPVGLDYVGLVVGAEYLVGYGLDHEGRFRNLPGLYKVERRDLETMGKDVLQLFGEEAFCG